MRNMNFFEITAQHKDGRPPQTHEWNARKYPTAYNRALAHYNRAWGQGTFELTPKPVEGTETGYPEKYTIDTSGNLTTGEKLPTS